MKELLHANEARAMAEQYRVKKQKESAETLWSDCVYGIEYAVKEGRFQTRKYLSEFKEVNNNIAKQLEAKGYKVKIKNYAGVFLISW